MKLQIVYVDICGKAPTFYALIQGVGNMEILLFSNKILN